jgi:isopentenyl-diphosphate delta-isomerase
MTSTEMSAEMAENGMAENELAENEMELVVLCAPDGSAIGTAPKATIHHRDTPLHLAFSCYVFDSAGRVLVTRRAYDKRTFPGVRTNSCCGHPAPGEGMGVAALRRLRQELGIVPTELELILPTFRYRATALDGTVENELCPVYRAVVQLPRLTRLTRLTQVTPSTAGTTQIQVTPQPAEVDEAWWVPWTEFAASSGGVDGTDPLSPWSAQQVEQLSALGPDPLSWPAGEPSLLPAAAVP